MKKKSRKSTSRSYFYGILACAVVIAALTYQYCFSAFSHSEKTMYVYIDADDNIDSVYHKIAPIANKMPLHAFRTLTHHSSYAEHIRTAAMPSIQVKVL